MSRPSTKYYSAAVPHPSIHGAFLGSYALPGEPAQWIMERGQQKVFGTAEDAELTGYRILMGRMNSARGPQSFVTRNNPRNGTPRRRTLSVSPGEPSIDEVFRKWKEPQDS
jgi:hypothetical protein